MSLHLDNKPFEHADTQFDSKVTLSRSFIENAYRMFGSDFAIVSSFGAESAVLLHLAASVSPDITVVFLDTGKLFGETKRYRDQLIETLGLTGVKTLSPDQEDIQEYDPNGILWHSEPDACCHFRKVVPLQKAISGFQAWASGRKRYQSLERAELPHLEFDEGKLKINPLAEWTEDDVKEYLSKHNLPAHPLVADGFRSIGCLPCTDRTEEGEDSRAGRWRGQGKTECGIHSSPIKQA